MTTLLLRAEAAWRLGPVALGHLLRHRAAVALGGPRRALADAAPPQGALLPDAVPPAPAVTDPHRAAVLERAAAVAPGDWHGPFDATAPALALDLFAPGDIRPVWERNRLADLPCLAQAARLDPRGPHLARAAALLAAWSAANPPFRGPNWACGQEAAIRALHLALALALLGAAHAPPAGARALVALHARRIAATPHYALAQDNNHPVSEAAGLLACGLLLGEADLVRVGDAGLLRAARRLIAPCGGFAQPSAGYHRLLLDVLALAEWLRRHLGGPPAPAQLLDRAAAATGWLARIADPATGALPCLGHCDGSAVGDLSLAGPDFAAGTLERAARLFLGASAGFAEDPGCAWLGLDPPAAALDRPDFWRGEGWMGLSAGAARAVLRCGPLRFRPGHADLLHLELWQGGEPLLGDGGTLGYNPPAALREVALALAGAAGHNGIAFDDADQMPRAGRFLFARWPATRPLPMGAAIRDHHGNRQAREIRAADGVWTVEDRLTGPFRAALLRWRLAPGDWEARPDGVTGPQARLRIVADAPVACRLAEGVAAPAYGRLVPAPVLEVRVRAPVSRITTEIRLGSSISS